MVVTGMGLYRNAVGEETTKFRRRCVGMVAFGRESLTYSFVPK